MPLTLTIDRARWVQHQRDLIADIPGLVPVAKGNGYGFGLDTLANQTSELGLDAIAVGIAQEVDAVRAEPRGFEGDIVVLNPWRPFDAVACAQLDDPQVIITVSRTEDLVAIAAEHPGARVLVEIETSMHRHGLSPQDVNPEVLDALTLEGWTIHLPANGSLHEARLLAQAGLAVRHAPIWVSHLSVTDYQTLHAELGGAARMRVGTRLWLGDKGAYRTTASVLDVHPVSKGEPFGYHQHRAPRDGFIAIISGGTAHGVAMAAPVPQRSLKQRAVTLAQGLLDAAGRTLSPFELGGKKRAFAEPPHMHSSMIFIPGPDPLVEVGDEVPVTTRMTTVTTDEISWR